MMVNPDLQEKLLNSTDESIVGTDEHLCKLPVCMIDVQFNAFKESKVGRATATNDPLLSYSGRWMLGVASVLSLVLLVQSCILWHNLGDRLRNDHEAFAASFRQITTFGLYLVFPPLDVIGTASFIFAGRYFKNAFLIKCGRRFFQFATVPYLIMAAMLLFSKEYGIGNSDNWYKSNLGEMINAIYENDNHTEIYYYDDDYYQEGHSPPTILLSHDVVGVGAVQFAILILIVFVRIHTWKVLGGSSVFVMFFLFGMSTMISGWLVFAVSQLIFPPNYESGRLHESQESSLVTWSDACFYWVIGSVIILASIFFAIWRYSVLKGAQALVSHDKMRYDKQWIEYKQGYVYKLLKWGSFEEDAANIHKALSEATTTNVREPKQNNKIQKLSELYMLAADVHPWFIKCVRKWHDAVNESRQCTQQQMEFSAKQCTLKAVERSIQKIHRVYGGKITRLVDVVRACIVCYDLSEVIDVLNAVKDSTEGDNPEVELVRWKNGYRDGTGNGSNQRGGYRDVQLILRTTGYPTCPLFLVELQICLVGIFLLKMKNEIPNLSRCVSRCVTHGERGLKFRFPSEFDEIPEREQARSRAKTLTNDDVHVENGTCELNMYTIELAKERSAQAEAVNRVFAPKARDNHPIDSTDTDPELIHEHSVIETAFTDDEHTDQAVPAPENKKPEGEYEKFAKLAYCPHCRLVTSAKLRETMKFELGKLSGHQMYKIRRNLLAE